MEAYLQHYYRLKEWLQWEREEEHERFRQQFLETPLSERKARGISWYPVEILEEEISLGGRLILRIQRSSAQPDAGQFSSGSIAVMFSMADPNRKVPPSMKGVIVSVSHDSLRFAPDEDELPDWTDEGKLGIDLSYDERSFREMDKALDHVSEATRGRLAELRDIVEREKPAHFFPQRHTIEIPSLNTSQNEALNKVLSARDFAIIHGPPGTGKTTTLVEAILLTLKEEKQVLVCAPSNLAVDLLTEKLDERGVTVLRLGHPARLTPAVLRHSLDMQVQEHPGNEEVKRYRKEAAKVRSQAIKFRRKFGREEAENRRALLTEARALRYEAARVEDFIVKDVFEKAAVITCTLVGAANPLLDKRRFSTVFIDEAAQALEPSCWVALLKADRFVLAGDHCQLPPTVKSDRAMRAGFGRTLFERLIDTYPDAAVMLRTQYRMHAEIMEYSSRVFYHHALEAHPSVAQWKLEGDSGPAVEFIDTAGCGFEEELGEETLSRRNEGEASLVFRVLHAELIMTAVQSFSTGIISPYKDQVRLLKSRKDADPELNMRRELSVDTVDGFQGQERDLVIISLVRSNDRGEVGFLADTRRMNVAMTRARKKLIIIGDSATISSHPFYRDLLSFVDEVKGYRTAWEFAE